MYTTPTHLCCKRPNSNLIWVELDYRLFPEWLKLMMMNGGIILDYKLLRLYYILYAKG